MNPSIKSCQQIVNLQSFSNLFLDFREAIGQRTNGIFYLNRTGIPISSNGSRSVHFYDLSQRPNIERYLKLNSTGRQIGYGLQSYDAIMEAWLITRLNSSDPVSPAKIRQFSDHLFYLNCTGRSVKAGLVKSPTAVRDYQNRLRNGQLIDLKGFVSGKSLKRLAGERGMTIDNLRPLARITDQQQLKRVVNHGLIKNQAIRQLWKSAEYQTAVHLRQRLIRRAPIHRSVNLSSSRAAIINALLAPHRPLHDLNGISYRIPGVSNNFLDDLLRWTRRQDRKHQLDHQLVQRFLPIYNAFKNLQGLNAANLKSLNQPDFNLNLPYVKANGQITNPWTRFGDRFYSQQVKLTQARRDSCRHLFRRSRRSGNWLINPKYRIQRRSSGLTDRLDIVRPLLAIRLNVFGQWNSVYQRLVIRYIRSKSPITREAYQRLFNTAHDLVVAKRTTPVRKLNYGTSVKLLGQLWIWQLGEELTLAGGQVEKVDRHGIRIAHLTHRVDLQLLTKQLRPLLPNPSLTKATEDLISNYRTLNQKQLWARIVKNHRRLLDPKHNVQALRFFQIVPHVKRWQHRFLFIQERHRIHHLGLITRCFLTKPQLNHSSAYLKIIKVTRAQWFRFNNDVDYHNRIIDNAEHGLGHITSYPHLKDRNVDLAPQSLASFTGRQRNYLYHQLNLKAYFTILRAM